MNQQSDNRESITLQVIILRSLTILTAFALGGLVAMVIVNRLLVAQIDVYLEISMTSASTIISFLDDIAPYLAGYIVGFSFLSLATLAAWVLSKVPVYYRRYGVALLAIVFVLISFWLFTGRSTDITPLQITPTPLP